MDETKTLMRDFDMLFSKIYPYNHRLLKKCSHWDENNVYRFNHIFDLYITSNAISWLKNAYLGYWFSPGIMLNSRCIIEGLAIKAMYDSGDISKEQIELLQKQFYLIEYNCYKQFSDISQTVQFSPSLLEDRERTCALFREKLKGKFSDAKIQKIVESTNPFLCDEKLSYHRIVELYLGEDCARMYGIFSQLIHPSDNTSYQDFNPISLLLYVYDLIKRAYGRLSPSKFRFSSYMLLVAASSARANRFNELTKQECRYIRGVANVFEEHFEYNYVSNTLQTFCLLFEEMTVDYIIGLEEQIKSKWKIMLELLASFYYCYLTQAYVPQRYELVVMHRKMQYLRNIKGKYDLSEAYACYRELYPNGCSAEMFAKNFKSPAGYTIDEKGHVKSLLETVRNFISKFSGDTIHDRVMYLDYFESQMISHANGYMWFSNSSAFADVNNIFIALDIGMDLILRNIYAMFESYETSEESKKYKNIVNVLRNTVKKMPSIRSERLKLLLTPKVSLL